MTVRLFADESVYGPTVKELRNQNFDVVRAVDVCPGRDDALVLAACEVDGRILLTEDADFGELAVRWNKPILGVVYLRLNTLPAADRANAAVGHINKISKSLNGYFHVIEPVRIRSRKLSQS